MEPNQGNQQGVNPNFQTNTNPSTDPLANSPYIAPDPFARNEPVDPNVFNSPIQQPAQVSQSQSIQPPVNSQAKTNPNSAQNMLKVAEIRDGIVIMEDGSYRSIIMVKAVNFDLMSMKEKEFVEYSYQGFLNALYFPVQIFIHSERVDLSPYLEKLAKLRNEQENMLLGVLMDDYIDFMVHLSGQTNIMDKRFYIVVPYFPVLNVQKAISQSKNFFTGMGKLFSKKQQHIVINEADLAKAKDELKNRVQAVLDGLGQANIQGLPLDTQELIELFYDTYNPDTATHQKLRDFNEVNAPIVQKGIGQAPQPNLDSELQV